MPSAHRHTGAMAVVIVLHRLADCSSQTTSATTSADDITGDVGSGVAPSSPGQASMLPPPWSPLVAGDRRISTTAVSPPGASFVHDNSVALGGILIFIGIFVFGIGAVLTRGMCERTCRERRDANADEIEKALAALRPGSSMHEIWSSREKGAQATGANPSDNLEPELLRAPAPVRLPPDGTTDDRVPPLLSPTAGAALFDQIFLSLEKDGSGMVPASRLREALSSIEGLSQEAVQGWMDSIDNNGQVSRQAFHRARKRVQLPQALTAGVNQVDRLTPRSIASLAQRQFVQSSEVSSAAGNTTSARGARTPAAAAVPQGTSPRALLQRTAVSPRLSFDRGHPAPQNILEEAPSRSPASSRPQASPPRAVVRA